MYVSNYQRLLCNDISFPCVSILVFHNTFTIISIVFLLHFHDVQLDLPKDELIILSIKTVNCVMLLSLNR